MIVLIDIGNTRAKYCFVIEGKCNAPIAILTTQLTERYLTDYFKGATRILVASVSHEKLTDDICAWSKVHEIDYQRVFSENTKNKIISGYTIPSQLGVDRWLTLVGAADLFPNCNVLVIDAGTATTVDFLLATGQHQGGWILAGINTLVSSVLAKTAHVKADSINAESISFGINTSDNVNNAAWAGTVGMVHLAISQIKKQGITLDEIIITGGNGHILSSLVSHQSRVIDELVFTGLQAYI